MCVYVEINLPIHVVMSLAVLVYRLMDTMRKNRYSIGSNLFFFNKELSNVIFG